MDTSDRDPDDDLHQKQLESFKRLCKKISWSNWFFNGRCAVIDQLYPLISAWNGQLPDLRDIFSTKEIERLLTHAVNYMKKNASDNRGQLFVAFVARTGYRDEPDVDEEGKPLLQRTTPIHRIANSYGPRWREAIREFFKIYDRRDVNYTDEAGLTHFHVACGCGFHDVVEKFLEAGQDPDLPDARDKRGRTPLHLALLNDNAKTVESLLRNGADPNLANDKAETPLHIICQKKCDDVLAKVFFKICDEQQLQVQVDAKDKSGRTPLQWALARLLPDVVDVLLEHGADPSSFVFPSKFDIFRRWIKCWNSDFKLREASGLLAIVDSLENRGYKLDRRDALKIMRLFIEYGFFKTSMDIDTLWEAGWEDIEEEDEDDEYDDESEEDDEEWRVEYEYEDVDEDTVMIIPGLSLYDLTNLRPEEAAKKLTYMDYFRFARSNALSAFPNDIRKNFAAHLCEKLSRRFFRAWALDSFSIMTRYRLPIEICEMIVDKSFANKDLWRICLAVDYRGSRWRLFMNIFVGSFTYLFSVIYFIGVISIYYLLLFY